MGCRIKSNVSKFVKYTFVVSAVLLSVVIVLSLVSGVCLSMAVIASGSMSPTLEEGDVIAWTPVDIEDVSVGDVVVFRSYTGWSGERVIAHRVTEVVDNDGVLMLGTKGDANEWDDQNMPSLSEPYIRSDHLLGRVVDVGCMGDWLNNIGIFVWLLFSMLLVFIIYKKKSNVSLV